MKIIYLIIIKIVDFVLMPLTLVSALWLKFLRYNSIGFWKKNSSVSRAIFEKVGIFPIVNHYYEPLFNYNNLKYPLNKERKLTGIELNTQKQLLNLSEYRFSDELITISNLPIDKLNFNFNKGPFKSGDAEILYNIVRYVKPKTIIEIGCGHSSLMIQHAIKKNAETTGNYECKHIAIEPFENKWLKSVSKIEFVEEMVENLNTSFFEILTEGDILFIDSTHMIRPQGDVLFEILEILPKLKSGVLIHFHDIFTPRDYLDEWLKDGLLFWNEQYLLEAFLSCNSDFEIYCAVNYLKNNYFNELKSCCPMLEEDRQPGSFWIKKL